MSFKKYGLYGKDIDTGIAHIIKGIRAILLPQELEPGTQMPSTLSLIFSPFLSLHPLPPPLPFSLTLSLHPPPSMTISAAHLCITLSLSSLLLCILCTEDRPSPHGKAYDDRKHWANILF